LSNFSTCIKKIAQSQYRPIRNVLRNKI
jgi:hypothetical protein